MAAVTVARASGDDKIPALDTTPPDTIKRSELYELGEKIRRTIKETVRGFDRTNDDYIEPQHYEFTVMMQVTRTFESFDLSSDNEMVACGRSSISASTLHRSV